MTAVGSLTLWQCESAKPTDAITPLTRSWEKAVPHQEIPDGLTSLSASSCGTCHVSHYEEWKLSTHAHAWTDLQFQAELRKESSPYLCINCHIPLQNQQEFVVSGLLNGDIYRPVKEKNPNFDRQLQQEGITCASCHVREGAVMGPTGSDKTPHKTVKGGVGLSEALCISCHNASAVVTPTLVCSFETGDEWKAGPYFGSKNCLSCHMEEVERERVKGFGIRKSRRHWFSGSGIPKHDTLTTTMLNGLEIYEGDIPRIFTENDSLKYTLRLVNEHAGHRVPSGDPERFILVEYELYNSSDSLLFRQTHRIGEEWEWHPEARKMSDSNMYPGEERLFLFKKQSLFIGSYKLRVRVSKHRMSEDAAAYNKLGKEYPRSIEIWSKEYSFSVK
jgi:nitrate reductase cytochrome c-type subunit